MTAFPTAAEFRAWLEAQPADFPVGITRRERACPLANCLRERIGGSPSVSKTKWREESYVFRSPLPKWAQAFVDAIDSLDERRPCSVTASGALVILRRVAPEAF